MSYVDTENWLLKVYWRTTDWSVEEAWYLLVVVLQGETDEVFRGVDDPLHADPASLGTQVQV